MYADYFYYTDGYLIGRDPVVPENVFAYWEKQARTEIDRRSYGRLRYKPELISEKVKDCVCEVAELLYRADIVARQEIESGAAGPLSSYSNDGESGTFDLSQSVCTESGKNRKVKEIIFRYLGDTGLLYAGVIV